MGVIRFSRTILLSSTFLTPAAAPAQEGALGLLTGETDGFAIDATTYTTAAELYTGGPTGGTVAVIDTGTPANNLSNVALDASNLVESGTSPKMAHFDSSPYVRWTPHNIVRDSENGGGTGWAAATEMTKTDNDTTAPDGTATADKWVESTNNAGHYNELGTAAASIISGAVYNCSVYLKPVGSMRWVYLTSNNGGTSGQVFDILNGVLGSTTSGSPINSTITSAGSGWYRCSFSFAAGSTTANIYTQTLTGDGTGGAHAGSASDGFYQWGSQIVRGYNANPYIKTTGTERIGIPQSYDTAAAKYGILVEPAATNLCLQSEDFSTTWTNTSTTDTSDTTAAPDGSTTADTITATATSNAQMSQNVTGRTDNAAHTTSVYAKKGTSTFLVIVDNYIADGTGAGAWFNLNTGVVGTKQANVTTSTITDVGNGWYRCTITGTNTTATDMHTDLYIADADNSTAVTNGNTIFLWGAQVETGSVATSYIPTLGSTVTRATDNLPVVFTSIPITNAQVKSASFYGRIIGDGLSGVEFVWIAPASGTANFMGLYTSSGANPFRIESRNNSVSDADVSSGINHTLGTAFKAAFRADTNSVNAAANGTAGTQDTSSTLSGTAGAALTTLYLDGAGRYNGSGQFSFGAIFSIYQFVIAPRAWSDSELQTKTT